MAVPERRVNQGRDPVYFEAFKIIHEMKKYIVLNLFLLAILSLITACQSNAPAEPMDDHADEDHAHEEGEILLNTYQMQNIGLKVGAIEQRNLNDFVRASGLLELPPDQKAEVSAKMAGNILTIRVHVGDYVRKGAVLAYIECPALIDLQENYLQTQATLAYLETELARQEELIKLETGARKQLEQTRADLAVQQSKRHAMEAQFKLLDMSPPDGEAPLSSQLAVRAPISGMIHMVHKNLGEYVEPQIPIFTVADNRHLHAEIHLFEKDLPSVRVGQTVKFFIQSAPSDLHEARIFSIAGVMDQETRAVNLHAEVNNEEGKLLPGMYIEARMPLGDQTVACLPADAVTTDKGLNYIFVKDHVEGNEIGFRKVQVVAGTTDAGYTAITPLEKLAENAEVVVEGAFFLLAESKKGEEEGGHQH